MYTSWDMRYFICTSGSSPPSLSSYPDKRQCSDQSSCVTWHRKHRYSRWNVVAIMCTSWDIRYCISTSSSRPPSLIFYPPWRCPVLTFVPLCCSMHMICGFRWNFKTIPSPMSGIIVSGFTSAILICGWTRIELCTGWCCYQQRWLRHPQIRCIIVSAQVVR